jgi:hypothetical protein
MVLLCTIVACAPDLRRTGVLASVSVVDRELVVDGKRIELAPELDEHVLWAPVKCRKSVGVWLQVRDGDTATSHFRAFPAECREYIEEHGL